MAVTTIEKILQDAQRRGMLSHLQKHSMKWFREKTDESKVASNDFNQAVKFLRTESRKSKINASAFAREAKDKIVFQHQRNAGVGFMYTFFYDPKFKNDDNVLPYYDRFPCIFLLHIYKDGFLGINLHYLPIPLRAKLMDALLNNLNNDRLDDATKLKITYGILKSSSKYKWFKPCVKRYLFKHVKSRLFKIPPIEWNIVCFLPLAVWEKEKQSKIWQDSREIIKGNNPFKSST